MGQCPFCQSDVDEDLLTFGGTCPKCFGEIPGDEAATDPGAAVRAEQAKSDDRRRLWRTLVPLLVAFPVLLVGAAVAIGLVFYNRAPTVETMVFDDVEDFAYDIVVVETPTPDPEPVASAKPHTGKRPVPNGTKVKPAPTGKTPKPAQEVDENGLPKIKVGGAPKPGIDFGGFGVVEERSGSVLKDPGQIRKMIEQKLRAYGRQLKQCYDNRLKTTPELQGRWTGRFTIQKSGFPTKVQFKGADVGDPVFEKCMAAQVAGWKFSKIATPQPVQKNWRFRN